MNSFFLSRIFVLFLFISSSFLTYSQCDGITVSLGNDLFYCSNQSVTLTATITSSSTTTYSWTFQASGSSNTQFVGTNSNTLTINSTDEGTYTVTASVEGCTTSVTDNLVLTHLNTFSVNAGLDQPICTTNGTVTITASTANAEGNTPTFSWSGPSAFASTSNPITVNTAGNYTVTATIGNCSVTDQMTVTNFSTFQVNAGNDVLTCLGTNVNLGATSSGGSSSVSYNWSGPNSYTASTQNITISNPSAASSGNYTVTATSGGCSKTDVVNVSILSPSVTSANFINYNGSQWLVQCTQPGETSGIIFIKNGLSSTLYPNADTYTVNWGDGSSNFTTANDAWNGTSAINHTYAIGNYTLTLTVTTSLGCTATQSYNVFVGNQPSSPIISNPANAQGCSPLTLTFPISNVSGNIPGTTYNVTFSDGTTPLTYTQATIPSSITHTFNSSSCGSSFTNGSITEQNAFGVSIQAINPCGSSSASAGPIRTSSPPTANFTIPSTVCKNQTATTVNTSIAGSIVSSSDCNPDQGQYWTISPATGWSLTGSSILGDNGGFPNSYAGWNSGTDNIGIIFSQTGNYTITLTEKNSCSTVSTATKTICVIDPPTCSFGVSPNSGCSPLTVTTTNNTIAPTCNGSSVPMSYAWSVVSPSGGTSSISNVSATNPTITLTNNSTTPLTFTIQLTATPLNSSNTAVTSCSSICTQTVTVNPRPTMTSATSANVCSGSSVGISLTSNIASTYSWVATSNTNVGGESTTNQTGALINDVLTNTSGSFQTVSYTVTPTSTTGSCVGTPQTVLATVIPTATMTNISSKTICSGSAVNISLTSNIGATYSWVATSNSNVNGESTSATVSTLINNTLTNTTTSIQTVTYTVTPTTTTGACVGTPQTILVTVIPPVAMNSPISKTICSGSAVDLALTANVAATFSWVATANANVGGESTTAQTTSTIGDVLTATTSQNVIYTVTPTSTSGSCLGTGQTVTISVVPPPAMTSVTTKTICSGQSVGLALTSNLASTYSWVANSNSNVNGESTTAQTGSTIADVLTNTSSTNQTVTYTITPTSTNGNCPGTPQTVTITVVPPVVLTNVTSKTICSGSTVGISLTTNVPATFSWSATDNVNVSGEPVGNQTTSSINNSLSTSSTTVQNVTYTVTPTSTTGSCPGSPQTIIVSVVPNITMTNTNTATICSGTAVNLSLTSNIAGTYSIIATDNANTTGETITAQIGTSISDLINNNTTINQNVIYTVTPTSSIGTCVGTPQTITVTVIPAVTMTNANSKTICSGSSVGLSLTSNVTSTYNWVANTDNTNVSGESLTSQTGNSINNTLINNSTSIQQVVYTVTPSSSLGSCGGTPQTVTITVIPPVNMTNSNSKTICSGSNVGISLTSNVASSYSWSAAANASTTGETTTASATTTINDALVNTTTNIQTVIYTVTPTSSAGLCLGAPQTITVTVMPPVSVTSVSSKTICSGVGVDLTISSNVPSSYVWSATDNTNVSGETTSSQTTSVISDILTNNSTTNQTVSYTITPTSTSGSCLGTAQTFVVTIVPVVTMSSVSSKTICTGANVNLSLSSNVASSYSWVAADNANTSGESTTAQIGPTINNTITNNSTTTQIVNYTVTPTSTIGSCIGTPQSVAISILPVVTMTNTSSATICSGTNVNFALTSNLASTYSWVAADNTSINGESVTSQTGALITNTLTNTSTSNQNVVYTVTPTSTNGACVGSPQTITITVIPSVTMTSTNTKTICTGNAVNISLTSNVASTYSWSATDNVNISGESTSPQSSNSISDLLTNNSTSIQTVTYSITPNSSIGGCPGVTQNLVVTVVPSVTLTNNSAKTICSGGNVNIALSSNVQSSYTWSATDNSSTSGESTTVQTSASISDVITNNSTSSQVVNYTITPTSTTGSCGGTPTLIAVTVLPVVTMSNANAVTICSGTSVNLSFTSNLPSSYSWVATDNPAITGESTTAQTGSILSNTLNSSATTNQLVTYTVTPTSTTGLCVGTPQTVTVTVVPAVYMTNTNSKTICSGSNVNLSLTSNVASSYSWSATDNASISGETTTAQTTTSISDVLVNNSTTSQTVTYTVTPTSAAGTCNGTPQTVTITIVPPITMTSASTKTICSGANINLTLSSNVPSSYSWSVTDNPNVSGESTTVQTTGTINNTLTNTTSSSQVVTYSVTPTSTSGSCIGTSQSILVTVNPLPSMTSATSTTICSGATLNHVLTSDIPSNYSWVATDNTNISGESLTAQTNSSITNTLTNSSSSIQTVTYTITPTSIGGSCVGNAQTLTVSVVPTVVITNVTSKTICSGTAVGISLTSNVPSAYSWSATDNLDITNESLTNQTSTSINDILTNTSNANQVVTYTVTPTSNSGTCVGAPQTISITVAPVVTMTNISSKTICSGSSVNISLTSNISSSYSWSAVDNASITGESTSAQNTNTINNSLVNTSSSNQNVVYTVIPTSTIGACVGASQTITVTVVPPVTMTNSNSKTICSGTSVALNLTSNVSSTYSWSATDNTNITGESTTAQTTNSITENLTNTSTSIQTVTYTITPTSTTGTCLGTPQTLTVTVIPTVTMTSQATKTICSGLSVNLPLSSNVASSYVWSATDNSSINGESLSNQTGVTITDNLTNTSTNIQTVSYSVTPSSTSGSCIGTSQTVTITIVPTVSMLSTNSKTICSGSDVAITFNTNVPSSFTWSATDNTNITGESTTTQTANAISNVLINNSTTNQIVTYSVIPTSTTGSCVGSTQTITVTVIPSVNITSANAKTICSGVSVNLNLTSNVSSNYSWVATTDNPNINGESLSPKTTTTIDDILTNTSSTNQVVTYTVTPTSSSGTCPGVSQTLTITIVPGVNMTNSNQKTICSGSNVNLSLTSNVTSAYSWVATDNPNITGESLSNQTTASITDNLVNTTSNVETVTYTVIPTSSLGLCAGSSQTVTITVNPKPVMTSALSKAICSNVSVNLALTATVSSDYSWIATANNSVSGESVTSQNSSTISDVLVNTSSSVQTVVYTVTPTSSIGGCVGNSQTVSITLNPIPTVTTPSNQIVCNGTQTSQVSFNGAISGTIYNWTNNNTMINLSGSGVGTITAFTASNTTNSPVSSIIIVTPSFVNAGETCLGSSTNFSISVNPTPTVNSISNQVKCAGTASDPITFSSTFGVTGTTYTWSNSTTAIGLSATGSNNISSFTTINSTNAPLTGQISVTPTASFNGVSCIGNPQSFTITVNPTPGVNAIQNQVICNATQTSPITFSGSVSGTTFDWTNTNASIGLAANGNGSISAFIGTNNTTDPISGTISVTPSYTNGGVTCIGTPQEFSITVNPTPTVIDPIDQTVCSGSSTTTVNFSGTGTSYTWSNSTTSIGLGASGTNGINAFTATNTGTNPTIATISVTPNYLNNNLNCTGTVQTFTITVNPSPIVQFNQSNQTICSQNASNSISISSPTSGANITWSVNSIASTISGVTTTSGTNQIPSFTLTNSGNVPAVVEFLASATTPGSVSCPGGGTLYTITVNPTPIVNDPTDQVVCNATTTNAVVLTGTGSSYNWTNSLNSIGLASNGTGNIGAFSAVNSTSTIQTATVTITPVFSNNNVSCNGPTQSFTITINPTPNANVINNSAFCNGVISTAISINGTGTSYNWINSNPSIGLASSGVDVIPSFTPINSGTTQTNSTISITPQFTNQNVTCQGSVSSFTIFVNPTPTANDPSDIVICNNGSTSTINFSGTGTSYSWSNDNTSIGLAGSGNGNIVSFNAINTSTIPVISTITVTPQFSASNTTCSGPPQTFTITVNPTPVVANPIDQIVCNGASTSIINFSGTGTSYNWVNNTPSIGLASNGTGDITPFTATNNNTTALIATITITPIYTGSSISCNGNTQDVQITINPTPTAVQPANQVVCNGNLSSTVVFSGNATSYSWTNSNSSIGLGLNGSGNIPAFTTTNTTTSPINSTITITPNLVGGSTSCSGSTQTFTFTINPTPTVNPIQNQVLCNATSTNAILFSGTGTSYQWTNNNSSIGLTTAGTNDIASFIATNSNTSPSVGTITVTPQYTFSNVTCSGTQQTATITVNPTPSVTAPQNVVVCNGNPTNLITIAGTGTSYSWTNSNPSIGLVASGNGNIPSFVASNTSNAPVSSTVTITPFYSNLGVVCQGNAQSFTITVNPTPSVIAPSNQLLCNGSNTNAVLFNGTANNYAWTNSIPSIGLSATGNGSIASFTAQNTGATSITAQIDVTPQYINAGLTCNGNNQSFTITIDPTPTVNDPTDVVVCNNSQTNSIQFTGSATNYSWSNSTTSIGLPANGTGNISAFQALNSTGNPVVATINVTPYFTTGSSVCPGIPQSFSITVNPTPSIVTPANQSVCSGSNTSTISFSGTGTSYNWTNDTPSIGLNIAGTGNIGAFAAQNLGSTPVVANLTVTPIFTGNSVGCNGTPVSFQITVNPLPHLDPIQDFTICNNTSFTQNLLSNIPSNFTWYAVTNPNVSGEVSLIQNSSSITNTLSNATLQPQYVQYIVSPVSTPEGCVGPDSSFVVEVMPDILLSIPGTAEICSGSAVNAVLSANVPANFTWFTTIDNSNVTGESITTNTGGIISDQLINTSTVNQIVIYSVTPVSVNGNCTGSSQTIAVTVKPPLALLNEDTLTICSGNAVNLNLVANTNVTFNWFANQNLNVIGESTSIVTSSTINDVLTNNGTGIEQVNYSVVGTSTFNGCSSPIFPIVIFVNPKPTVNPISNKTYCNGTNTGTISFSSSINGTNYSWSNSNTAIGLAANGTGDISGFNVINNGNSAITSTVTVTPNFSSNGVTCIGVPQQFTITVNPTPIVNPIQNQTICFNTSTSSVVFSGSINGTVYSWVNSNTVVGLGNLGTGTIASFTGQNPTFNPITANITVTPTYTNNAVSCQGNSSTFSITVQPKPDVITPNNQIICNGLTTNPVVFTSNTSSSIFNWTNSNNSIGLGASGNGNISSFTALNSSNAPVISTITITPQIQVNTLTCTGNPTSFTYQINPTPTVDPMPSLTFCNNTNSLIDFTSTFMNNNSSVGYDWQNSNTAIGISANGSGDINFLATNSTNAPETSTISVIPTYNNNGLTCFGSTETILITINPTPTVDPLISQTFCATSNAQINFTSAFNVSSTIYNWTNNNTSIGLAASGQGTISFTSQNTTSNPITASITVTPNYTNNGLTCAGTPQNFLITINPIPIVNAVASQTLCNNSNSTAVVFTSNVSNPSFSWSNSNTSIGLGALGNGNIPSFVAQNATSNSISGNLQVNVSYTNNGVTCSGNNQLFSITVNPSPTVNPIANQSICNNDITTQINFNGTVSGTTFSWVNSNTTIGLVANGNGNIPSFTGINTSNSISVAQITVTPSATINGISCSGTPQQFTITVNPTPTVNPIVNSTYCNGSSTNNVVFSGNISGTVYNWTSSNSAIGLPTNGSGNITSFVATNLSTVPISSIITVIPVVTNNGITCSGNPQTFTVTVNPTPVVTDPSDQVVCSGAPVNAIVFNSLTPSTVYNWQNDTPSIGLSASGTGNIASFIATNNLTATVTATVTVTPSYTNNITCQGAPQSFTIAVNPKPTVIDPTDQVVCNGTLTNTVGFSGNVIGTIYDWSNSNASIGLATTGTGTINSFTGINTSFSPITGSIVVTPSYSNLGLTCIGNSQTFTITVNPIPNVVDPANQVVCNSTPTAAIIFTGNVNGTVYNWTNSNNSIGIGNNGVGNINSFTAINSTTTPIVSNFTVVSSYTNGGVTCTGNTENFTITVNPSATLTNASVQICSNQNVNTNLTSSIPSTFTWQAVNNILVTGETFSSSQNSSFINDLLLNGSNSAQIVNYTITLISTQYGCSSNAVLPVTVNPLPNVQFNVSNPPPCNLTPVNFQNNTMGNNNYLWSFGDGGSSTLTNPSHIYTNIGTYSVVLTATNNQTGCVDSLVSSLTILESPPVGFTVDKVIGCEVLDVKFTDTLNTPNTTLIWNFDDGQTSNQSNSVDHQYANSGCYDVSLTVTSSNGCAITQTQQDMVCVYEQPIASFNTNDVNFIVDDAQVVFTNTSYYANTYFWDFGDGDTSLATNPIHTYNSLGEFDVTLYAYSIAGCYDSARITISVVNDVLIYVPNTITVNADGTNDVFLPVIGDAFLKETYHLMIYNRWGQIVFESYNSEIGWDATYTGPIKSVQQVQDGTYTWVITIKLNKNEDYRRFVGHVNVLNSKGDF
ncbi:MAG: PKD domain-containing protein [Flavobacteriales bacterium]|nr:PKD domain-containing protein [Flavobacteriales bacterium]